MSLIVLPVADAHFRKRMTYQHPQLKAALAYVQNWRVAVDIGAHVGFFSRTLSKLFQRVYAFEPEPENFACLQQNVSENVRCTRVALGEEFGEAALTTPKLANSGAWETTEGTGVTVVPLDGIWLNGCDFLKIDAQGDEFDILLGAEQTLKEHHPVIMVEIMVNGRADERIDRWLVAHGYIFAQHAGKNSIYI